MFQYRQALVRMRQGDSDGEIAAARLMGRRKAGELRQVALEQGWLDARWPLPDEAQIATVREHGFTGTYSAVCRMLADLRSRT